MGRLSLSLVTAAAIAAAVTVPSAPAPAAPSGSTLEVAVSRAGFEPSTLTIRRGETAHVVVTSTDVEHCFAVDELRVEKRVVPGRPTRFDLAVDKPGTYAFHCCLESGAAAERERGQLTVGE